MYRCTYVLPFQSFVLFRCTFNIPFQMTLSYLVNIDYESLHHLERISLTNKGHIRCDYFINVIILTIIVFVPSRRLSFVSLVADCHFVATKLHMMRLRDRPKMYSMALMLHYAKKKILFWYYLILL